MEQVNNKKSKKKLTKEQLEKIAIANSEYVQAVFIYNNELRFHAESEERYARALINYQRSFQKFIQSQNMNN